MVVLVLDCSRQIAVEQREEKEEQRNEARVFPDLRFLFIQ